jgi:hypothetical protein
MARKRAFSPHVKWLPEEVAIVRSKYKSCDWELLFGMLPGRTKSQIQNKANLLGIIRRPEKLSANEVRKRKRELMARRRADNPDAAREYQRAHFGKNREKIKEKMRNYSRKRFFWSRSMKLRTEGAANAKQLASLWKAQRGRCGLTGRRMDASAQLDHIKSRAAGGTDSVDNLRWTCKEANLAKRELSDEDFLTLCRDICSFIDLKQH